MRGLESGEAMHSCGSGLGREALPLSARISIFDAALSSAQPTGCALHGASLFLVWPRKSNQKEGHPYIRVLLRKTSLTPALLRGSSRRAIPGPSLLARHPCLATPYATPTLGLLKGIWDRVVWEFLNSNGNKALRPSAYSVGWKTAKHFPPRSALESSAHNLSENRWVSFALPTLRLAPATASLHCPSDATKSPLSQGRAQQLVGWVQPINHGRWASPILRSDTSTIRHRHTPLSEGRAQVAWKGLSGMDAARAALGHGWPVAAGAWNVTGAREPRRSRGRMQGQDFLLTFLAFEKSESPSRAKPSRRPAAPMGPNQSNSDPSPKASRSRPLPRKAQPMLPLATRPSGVQALSSQVLPC